jgi:hypothetical protein
MRIAKVVAGAGLALACAASPSGGPEARPPNGKASGKDMLSGGGCYVRSCVAGLTQLRLPCVTSIPSIQRGSLKTKVEWHVGRKHGQKSFDFDFPIADKPVALPLPLPATCDSEVDSIVLNATAAGPNASDPHRVTDVIVAKCATEPRCGQ